MHSILERNIYIGSNLLHEESLVSCPSLHLRASVLHSLAQSSTYDLNIIGQSCTIHTESDSNQFKFILITQNFATLINWSFVSLRFLRHMVLLDNG